MDTWGNALWLGPGVAGTILALLLAGVLILFVAALGGGGRLLGRGLWLGLRRGSPSWNLPQNTGK